MIRGKQSKVGSGGKEIGKSDQGFLMRIGFDFFVDAGVAQMVEHQPSKLRVAGSIPVSRSIRINLYR